MFEYENISGRHLMIPGVGEVAAGETIKSEVELESANLKPVVQQAPPAPEPAPAPAPTPQPVAPPVAPAAAPTPATPTQEGAE